MANLVLDVRSLVEGDKFTDPTFGLFCVVLHAEGVQERTVILRCSNAVSGLVFHASYFVTRDGDTVRKGSFISLEDAVRALNLDSGTVFTKAVNRILGKGAFSNAR